MEPNWFGNIFKRLSTGLGSDLERTIVGNLEGLLDHPNDENLIDATIQQFTDDPQKFMSIVSAHFSVPMPVAGTGLFAKADASACGMAKTWKNYVATQTAQPYEIACPASLADLQAVLQKAAALHCAVRASGSHHAFSDAALTDGIAIETHQLLEALVAADPAILKNPEDASTVVRVPGGMTIHNLNVALDQRGIALVNMGSYDGQTLAGVISTSTHGSGITLGAFPSAVEALIVVKADAQVVQIEPSHGITDPAKFAAQAGNVQLIQDDKFFQASVVGIGSLGVILAVLLRVRRQYWLSETVTLHPWSELRPLLRDGALIRAHRHVEVVLNPHVLNGDNTCMLTLRDEVPKPTAPIDSQAHRWPGNPGFDYAKRQQLARELLRRGIESRVVSMTDERPFETLFTHTEDELRRALAQVTEPTPVGYADAFVAVQQKWKHAINCWSAAPFIPARVLSNWYPISEGIPLYGATYDSTEHFWQAVKYHSDTTVADLNALLALFEHQSWTSWLARLDADPSLYLANAYAIEFLRINLKGERLRWFRDQLTTHNLQPTEHARAAQQRTAAPFRFSAFEEKVIWGDLADVFHLVYTFSLPDDPLCATLAHSHFDAIYLSDRRMPFISEDFRSLMLEIWHVKYLQMPRFREVISSIPIEIRLEHFLNDGDSPDIPIPIYVGYLNQIRDLARQH